MKFSVVTISFNQAEFLERTIQSVIAQTGVEVEYIIADPGSTDGSRDIIERYRPHFAKVILEKDAGAADGLNRGFAHATGDIYCYLNSDDTFEPEAFATVRDHFATHAETDVVCGHAWITDRQDARLRRTWSEPYWRLFVAYGVAIQIQPSTFFRASAFRRTKGFNAANRRTWDAELLLDMYQSGSRIEILDAFLSSYRLHETSITNSSAMLDQSRLWSQERFRRLMGREPSGAVDDLTRAGMRFIKHARRPEAFAERLLRGRIQGRGVR